MKEAKFKVGDKVFYNNAAYKGYGFVITDMRYVYYPTGDDWEYTLEHETNDRLISIRLFGSERLVAYENIVGALADAITTKPTKKNKKHKKNKEKRDLSHDNL